MLAAVLTVFDVALTENCFSGVMIVNAHFRTLDVDDYDVEVVDEDGDNLNGYFFEFIINRFYISIQNPHSAR